jgi:hypothetical protein
MTNRFYMALGHTFTNGVSRTDIEVTVENDGAVSFDCEDTYYSVQMQPEDAERMAKAILGVE